MHCVSDKGYRDHPKIWKENREQNKYLARTFTGHTIFRNMFIFCSFYQKPGDYLSARKGKDRNE